MTDNEPGRPGTEWTEPGQGATVVQLWRAAMDYDPPKRAIGNERVAGAATAIKLRKKYAADPADSRTVGTEPTNLRLTGSPLTAEDLKRIEQAEIAR